MNKAHPRYESLKQREALLRGYKKGITALAGLIAQGRGEAFDYLLGERTNSFAKNAIRAAAALLLSAKSPVISVNGNTAVLCPKEIVRLAKLCNAKLEINLFYRSQTRVKKIKRALLKYGAGEVYGIAPDREVKGIASGRRLADSGGIYSSNAVLVALEDGDRTEALIREGKKVIAIDLNPLSRTAQKASITIVDNVIRVIPELIKSVIELKKQNKSILHEILENFDNQGNLKTALDFIKEKV
ncbi:MAG: phosphopantothenate/pantothenate synthetase [Candidatus Hydrothermarchaeota archaeon]|nr:phosphopantothenate/pantothenate synthetase [Candidatus Hydrothermarchaeota archaeon]